MSRRLSAGLVILSLVGLVLATSAKAQDEPNPIAKQVRDSVKDPKKPFTMIVIVKVKEGAAEKFEKAFAPAIKATLKEKGCLNYNLARDTKMADHYALYERWANVESLEAHLKSDHIRTLLGTIHELMNGAPEVHVLVPVE